MSKKETLVTATELAALAAIFWVGLRGYENALWKCGILFGALIAYGQIRYQKGKKESRL